MMEFRNHDWVRTIAAGTEMAVEAVRRDVVPTKQHIMWELLREAARTSQAAYSAPPRTGYPGKSAMPEAPDDLTYWQRMAAYLRGDLEEADVQSRAPRPSAEQISRAEVILAIWHNACLTRKGDKSRMKKAVYLKACGVPDKRISMYTGLSRYQINRAKEEAMGDMLAAVQAY